MNNQQHISMPREYHLLTKKGIKEKPACPQAISKSFIYSIRKKGLNITHDEQLMSDPTKQNNCKFRLLIA